MVYGRRFGALVQVRCYNMNCVAVRGCRYMSCPRLGGERSRLRQRQENAGGAKCKTEQDARTKKTGSRRMALFHEFLVSLFRAATIRYRHEVTRAAKRRGRANPRRFEVLLHGN